MDSRVMCLYFEQDVQIQPLAEACFRFTPQVSVRQNKAIFLEVGGSFRFFTKELLQLRVQALCRRFGAAPRIAFGADAPTALAMARYGVLGVYAPGQLPLIALQDYASPFSTDEKLFKRVFKVIQSLESLGIKTLSDFTKLPKNSLASRFGVDGVELTFRIKKGRHLVWPRFALPEEISETINLAEGHLAPCQSLEPLLFILKRMADRCMARVRARGKRVSSLEISWELEKYSIVKQRKKTILVPFSLPQGSVYGLLPILRERLSTHFQRNPLAAPILEAKICIKEMAPGLGSQRDFFSRKEDQAEAWSALVGRISEKMGSGSAFVALPVERHMPEFAWKKSLKEFSELENVNLVQKLSPPFRPARVLKKPEPLKRKGGQLIPFWSQHSLSQGGWKIASWKGPERISGEWWWDEAGKGFERDYYRVLTDEGEELWVFKMPSSKGVVYLHGYFD